MLSWNDSERILLRIRRVWEQEHILRDSLQPSKLFPWTTKIGGPNSKELNEHFAEVDQWIKKLVQNDKEHKGYGYTLEFEDRANRLSGSNLIPVRAIVETREDALRMLKKEKDEERYLSFAKTLMDSFPDKAEQLHAWLLRHPLKVLECVDTSEEYLAILRWFRENPASGLYLRQLDIPGVDTKFIELNRNRLAVLLRIVIPGHPENHKVTAFASEFGLRSKPATVRFRVLDESLAIQGLTDIEVPIEQFASLDIKAQTIFITENEINGLCLPQIPGAMVIFGLGYGAEILRQAAWLADKAIYYWGDIDTHGFAILNHVRAFLPQTVSLMMDEKTLLDNQWLWVSEGRPLKGSLENLTDAEQKVYRALCEHTYGKKVRLEQERIPFQSVLDVIDTVV